MLAFGNIWGWVSRQSVCTWELGAPYLCPSMRKPPPGSLPTPGSSVTAAQALRGISLTALEQTGWSPHIPVKIRSSNILGREERQA